MISPARLVTYWPGRDAVTSPDCRPLHSEPPWCGQRLRTAKYSPLTLNTPTLRPPISTILRPPGGMSSTVPTMYRAISGPRLGKTVPDASVLGHDLSRPLRRE